MNAVMNLTIFSTKKIRRHAQNAIFLIVGNLKKKSKKDQSESDGNKTEENMCFCESSKTFLNNNSKPPHSKFKASLNRKIIP